jgi:Domain of unknown function (DUF929)
MPGAGSQTAGRGSTERILRHGFLTDAMSNRTQLRAQARQQRSTSQRSTSQRSTSQLGARQKIAAQRVARERRRRLLLAGGSLLAVVAIVGTFIGVKLTGKPSAAVPVTATADAAVARAVTSVPASTLNAAGTGGAAPLRPIAGHQPLLTSGGKPEVFYVGAEFCPFCAAERWALTVALSRFGTFSGLHFIHSTSDDYAPDTPTLTFYKSSYHSKYLTFTPVELQTVTRAPLQAFTAAQSALYATYDSPPYVSKQAKETFPFVDLGNQALISGAQYSPTTLSGLTWSQVAAAIKNPDATIGKEVNGAANMITAELCKLTHGRPANVCASAGVTAAG